MTNTSPIQPNSDVNEAGTIALNAGERVNQATGSLKSFQEEAKNIVSAHPGLKELATADGLIDPEKVTAALKAGKLTPGQVDAIAKFPPNYLNQVFDPKTLTRIRQLEKK